MKFQKLMMVSFATAALALSACSGDDGGDDDGTVTPPPNAPTLGTQIDRSGRPAISTALIAVLEADDGMKGTAKDAYNAAGPSAWSSFAGEIAANLAVYDSLDTDCGNQLLNGVGTATNAADRYMTLAGALADDRLYVNASVATCTQYFAAELTATGVADLSADCGGRAPSYDVIDVTYSALAVGAISGAGDGIDADDASHDNNVFPFLAN